MYLPVETQQSCARAWVQATLALINNGDEAYNVIIDVQNPQLFDEQDHAIISVVDDFLREHEQNPIITVANTIFPQPLLEELGYPLFMAEYLRAYDALHDKGWGRYFERMIRHKKLDGQSYNPLLQLIQSLCDREESGPTYKSAYELALYDPLLDGRRLRNRQCLSFLSFKRHPSKGLMLTAMYRNHHYITRCLGNLIGLSQLQAFIAEQVGIPVGSLTCISTHAELDTAPGKWGKETARSIAIKAHRILTDNGATGPLQLSKA